MTFAPGELSTIEAPGVTKAFDFAQYPCLPPGVTLKPGERYQPVIAPPKALFALDRAFATCIPGAHQGTDDFITLYAEDGIH